MPAKHALILSLFLGLLAIPRLHADEPVTGPVVLVDEDFRTWDGSAKPHGLEMLPRNLPTTLVRDTPHRAEQGVPRAFTRDLTVEPQFDDGLFNITLSEVEQGANRIFKTPVPFDHDTQALVMRMTTFTDALLQSTNSTAVRLWVQRGQGYNYYHERLELANYFNANPRGNRQVHPTGYFAVDNYETWALPEGTNRRRTGIYHRIAAEGRNDEIRGGRNQIAGYYWTWRGLDWRMGWENPVGGAMYEPSDVPEELAERIGEQVFTTTVVARRQDTALEGFPTRFATQVDVQAPRTSGRIVLQSPLPRAIGEIRLILRSEVPAEGKTWYAISKHVEDNPPVVGVADVHVSLVPRADATLDGIVDEADWNVLRENAGTTDAIHQQGDANGDGVVDLEDAFWMARQWSAALDDGDPDPTLWQSWTDADGVVKVRVPAGTALYAWQLILVKPEGDKIPVADDLPADITPLMEDEGAMVVRTSRSVGMANLVAPFEAGEEDVDLSLVSLPDLKAWQALLRVQTTLGSQARIMPVVVETE